MITRAAITLSLGGSFNRPRDWQAFEHLTRDLFALLFENARVDLNGRSGQQQAGVDVFGLDQSGKRIGIQCKGRGDPQLSTPLSEAEMRAEVLKATRFQPALDRFILLTTGPNDTNLKRLARELSDDPQLGFEVEFFGWDWIEAQLSRHVELASTYGLIAVASATSSHVGHSPIAAEIGERLQTAILLMNEMRSDGDRFSLQSLSRNMGQRDWRRLEGIVRGTADADHAELAAIAEAFGLSEEWLIEGKGAPFARDPGIGFRLIEELHAKIVALAPRTIVYIRQREGGHGHHDALIALQCDDVRWHVFRDPHPACGHVGGTGQWQLYDLCRLMRRFDRADEAGDIHCFGIHLDSPDYERLLDGEIYPGSLLADIRNDGWWLAFGALRADWIEGDGEAVEGLKKAIAIVEHKLAEVRKQAHRGARWSDNLRWGHFADAPPTADEEGEPWA